MPVRLTETAISKAIREVSGGGARRDLADEACPGLRLRLTPAGSKSWVLACRDPAPNPDIVIADEVLTITAVDDVLEFSPSLLRSVLQFCRGEKDELARAE